MAAIDTAFSVEGLSLNDTVGVFGGTSDPSTGVGFVAPTGSLYLCSSGATYQKFDSTATGWRLISTTGSTTPTVQWGMVQGTLISTGAGGSRAPSFTRFANNGTSQGVFCWSYASGSEQELYFVIELPHSYKEGTDLLPNIHWAVPTTEVNNVVWGFEYIITNEGNVFPTTTTITETVVTTTGIANQHIETSPPVIPGLGINISTVLMGRLYRKGQDSRDTYSSNVLFVNFELHIQQDTLGSSTPAVK